MSSMKHNESSGDADAVDFVTVMISDQLFGLPISRVEDVFSLQSITPVPLSYPEVAGVLNLRGRIVTAIDMRVRLNVTPRSGTHDLMAVGVEYKGESYGLIIDRVGEVLRLSDSSLEQNPTNLDERWRSVAKGVHQLDGRLMVVLDIDQVLASLNTEAAA